MQQTHLGQQQSGTGMISQPGQGLSQQQPQQQQGQTMLSQQPQTGGVMNKTGPQQGMVSQQVTGQQQQQATGFGQGGMTPQQQQQVTCSICFFHSSVPCK